MAVTWAPGVLAWLSRQQKSFGSPFLACVCIVYFAQGFRSLSANALNLFLKNDLSMAPADIQMMMAYSALPWSFKPVYGIISDSWSIYGLHRKPYLVLGALIGLVAWVALALLAARSADITVPLSILATLLTFSNLSTALSDVIVDAMVAERCGELARSTADGADQEKSDESAGTEGENALQTLSWGSLAVGGLAGSAIGMVAASKLSVGHIFLVTASCPALVLVSAGFLSESRSAEQKQGGGAAVATQIRALFGALRQPSIYRPLIFFFLSNALVPSCGQAMLFFYTDELKFSPEFMAAQGIVAFACLLLGSVLYSKLVQGCGFRKIFISCQLLLALLSVSDVILALRLNVAFGIPDKVFVIGSDAVSTVISRLTMQPFFVIAARLCPPGCEAALYAAFMSVFNGGNAMSGAFGAQLLPYFGIESGAYAGLPALLGLRSAMMLLPLLLIDPLLGGAFAVPKTDAAAKKEN